MNLTDLKSLCVEMRDIEDEKARLEAELKLLNVEYDRLRLGRIPEMMDALEVKNATFEGIGRVQLAADIHASTREGQKDPGIAWLRDCGYEGMVTEGYNASSLKALFRRMIIEGVPIPEEIFNVTPFVRASIVKS